MDSFLSHFDGRLQNRNHPWKLETKAGLVSSQGLLVLPIVAVATAVATAADPFALTQLQVEAKAKESKKMHMC